MARGREDSGPSGPQGTWGGGLGTLGGSETRALLDSSLARARCPRKAACSTVAAWQERDRQTEVSFPEDGRVPQEGPRQQRRRLASSCPEAPAPSLARGLPQPETRSSSRESRPGPGSHGKANPRIQTNRRLKALPFHRSSESVLHTQLCVHAS